jgi:hypothetical protein
MQRTESKQLGILLGNHKLLNCFVGFDHFFAKQHSVIDQGRSNFAYGWDIGGFS